jgi:hypothetical protein
VLSTLANIGNVLRVYNVKKSAVKIYLFPARESLASDIPAGDGKTINIYFYNVPL